jgi:hypothetical protein
VQPADAAADWQALIDNILAGNELHANTRDLAAKMVRSGIDGGAIVNFLRGLMNSSAAPRDEAGRPATTIFHARSTACRRRSKTSRPL